jgi:hypothetical protein
MADPVMARATSTSEVVVVDLEWPSLAVMCNV